MLVSKVLTALGPPGWMEASRDKWRHSEHHVWLRVMGPVGVGKTCLVLQHLNKGFHPIMYRSTCQENFYTSVHLDGEGEVPVLITDHEGTLKSQNLEGARYSALPKMLQPAVGIIIVFDMTRGLDQVRDFWPRALQAHSHQHSRVMLLGTHLDEPDKRKVSEEEARGLAAAHGWLYAEVSCMTGAGVREAFAAITREVRHSLLLLQTDLIGWTREDRDGLAYDVHEELRALETLQEARRMLPNRHHREAEEVEDDEEKEDDEAYIMRTRLGRPSLCSILQQILM